MKPNQLLIVLGFNAGDAVLAERLMDWCYELNGRQPIDHPILLVAAPNAHAELQEKVKLAAEVAFEHVELVPIGGQIGEKVDGGNRLFKAGAFVAFNNYRAPWLWLEPDCVPLRKEWLSELQSAYEEQPRRFFGPHAKFGKDFERMLMCKTSIYPHDALNDLSGYCDSIVPFNQMAAETIVTRSTKCRLIQQGDIRGAEDFSKIRPDAVLLHSDKTGQLIQHYRSSGEASTLATVATVEKMAEAFDTPTTISPPTKPSSVIPAAMLLPPRTTTPKVDGRSKAARDAKKAAVTA